MPTNHIVATPGTNLYACYIDYEAEEATRGLAAMLIPVVQVLTVTSEKGEPINTRFLALTGTAPEWVDEAEDGFLGYVQHQNFDLAHDQAQLLRREARKTKRV